MQRDYWYSSVRDWRELEDGDGIGKRAAERALRRLNARKLATTTAPVLFAPELARGLFGHFLGAIRGGSQYRKRVLSARRRRCSKSFPPGCSYLRAAAYSEGARQHAVRQ